MPQRPLAEETIQTRDLIASWKSDFGIDVAHLFDGINTVRFMPSNTDGPARFDPPVMGDAAFYQALREFTWYHPASKAEFKVAAKWLPEGGSALDIGAGQADFAAYVSASQYRGLETDETAASKAKARGIDVRAMTMADYLASPDIKPAYLVTAFQVLEHIAEPETFIAEMVRCAAPGGHIAIGVPNAESYVADLPDFMLNAPPHHVTWWTERSLATLLESCGLGVAQVWRAPVERWERQIWWMAKVANIVRPARLGQFGSKLRARKVVSYVLSLALQIIPPPKSATGSTLVIVASVPVSP